MKSIRIKKIKSNERFLTNLEAYCNNRFLGIYDHLREENDENIRNDGILFPFDKFYPEDSELKFKYELDIDFYKRKLFNTKCKILNEDLKSLISSYLSTKIYFVFKMTLSLFYGEDNMHPLIGLSSTLIEYPRYTTQVIGEKLFKCRDIIKKINKLTVLKGNMSGKLGLSDEQGMQKEICNYIYHLGIYFKSLYQ